MKTPIGSTSRSDRLSKWLVRVHSNSWIVRLVVVPIIIGGPPVLVTAFYSNIFAVLFVGIYPTLMLMLGKEVFKRAETNGLNVEGLLALINSLDQIVGYKNNR